MIFTAWTVATVMTASVARLVNWAQNVQVLLTFCSLDAVPQLYVLSVCITCLPTNSKARVCCCE